MEGLFTWMSMHMVAGGNAAFTLGTLTAVGLGVVKFGKVKTYHTRTFVAGVTLMMASLAVRIGQFSVARSLPHDVNAPFHPVIWDVQNYTTPLAGLVFFCGLALTGIGAARRGRISVAITIALAAYTFAFFLGGALEQAAIS